MLTSLFLTVSCILGVFCFLEIPFKSIQIFIENKKRKRFWVFLCLNICYICYQAWCEASGNRYWHTMLEQKWLGIFNGDLMVLYVQWRSDFQKLFSFPEMCTWKATEFLAFYFWQCLSIVFWKLIFVSTTLVLKKYILIVAVAYYFM